MITDRATEPDGSHLRRNSIGIDEDRSAIQGDGDVVIGAEGRCRRRAARKYKVGADHGLADSRNAGSTLATVSVRLAAAVDSDRSAGVRFGIAGVARTGIVVAALVIAQTAVRDRHMRATSDGGIAIDSSAGVHGRTILVRLAAIRNGQSLTEIRKPITEGFGAEVPALAILIGDAAVGICSPAAIGVQIAHTGIADVVD